MRLNIVVASIVLAGCAATGVRIDDAALASLQPGQSTVDQVVATFGAPTTRMRMADGSTLLLYTYAEAKVRPASLIPIVGAFAGGTDVRSNSTTLRFGKDGKLVDVATTESQYGTGVGSSAGNVTPGPVPQPRQEPAANP